MVTSVVEDSGNRIVGVVVDEKNLLLVVEAIDFPLKQEETLHKNVLHVVQKKLTIQN
jgi:hypothetical protein